MTLTSEDVAKLIGRVFLHRAAVNLLGSVLDTPEFFVGGSLGGVGGFYCAVGCFLCVGGSFVGVHPNRRRARGRERVAALDGIGGARPTGLAAASARGLSTDMHTPPRRHALVSQAGSKYPRWLARRAARVLRQSIEDLTVWQPQSTLSICKNRNSRIVENEFELHS